VGASVRASVGASVRDSVGASVRASVGAATALRTEYYEVGSWGQHDANIFGFYDYFREVLSLEKQTAKFLPLTNLAKETGWHLFYKDVAILSEKPIEIHRNEQGRLHHPDKPAIKWADGYELYRLNGIIVPEAVITTPKEKISKEMYLSEKNADIRREIARKIGMDRFAKLLDAKVIDTMKTKNGGTYELLEIDFDQSKRARPYLRMKCPSTKHVHVIGVPVGTLTAVDGWKFINNETEVTQTVWER
jgi:hypothetical protein